MAAFVRQNIRIPHILTLLSCLLLLLAHASNVSASPIAKEPLPRHNVDLPMLYWKRGSPVVVASPTGNGSSVLNPATNQIIAQGSGTDGSGDGFSLPAIIWLAFVSAVGIPLAFAGIRLWRFTTGMAVGLAVTVSLWAAFVNTVSSDGLPDIVLAIIGVGGFAIGFGFGFLSYGRWAGIILIGVLGGFSVGLRIVLLRPGLLIPTYLVNWLVLALFMVLGLAIVLARQHIGMSFCCAAIGTFLVGLAVDLFIEQQNGMSFALRFFFDRNDSHFLAIVHKGYSPSTMTQIILGASLGATPILAFAQHKIFKGPFRPESGEDTILASFAESEPGLLRPPSEKPLPPASRMQLLRSRFSLT